MGPPTDVLAPAPPRSRGLISRVVPPSVLGRRRALLLIERDLMVYRRQWMIVISGLFEPLFYLLSIGVGIGKLVGDVHGGGQAVSYSEFVAPALMASSAMNGAIYESTMNVFFKLKYAKVYEAVLATPVSVADVALGEVGYALLRGGAYAVVFLCVMLAMGLVASWWAVLAVPAAILIGFAFAGAGLAATSYMKSWQDFDLVQLAILPLFLFSATFYPLSTYPRGVRLLVRVTPLYQGVALLRGLTLGHVGPATLGHVLYLAVMGAIGLRIATRRLGRLLQP
jgi:lipooligosaccharide transport system permease protein